MKNFARVLSLLLALIFALAALVSCDKTKKEDPKPDPEPEKPEVVLTSLKIGGEDISSYTIVYGENYYEEADGCGYEVAANRLAELLEEKLGKAPEVKAFAEGDDLSHKIVFGNVKDDVTDKFFRDYRTMRSVGTGKKTFHLDESFHVYGNGKGTVYFLAEGTQMTKKAAEYFVNTFLPSQFTEDCGDVDLAPDFSYKDSHHLYTVGCIGDSITYGAGASLQVAYAYPFAMQRELGDEYRVVNFGCNAMTMCTNHSDAYVKCTQYQALVNYADKLDMVFVMLGTNDADRFGLDWTDAVVKDYTDSFHALMKLLKDANPDVKIILFNPPICYRTQLSSYHTPWNESIEKNVVPLVKQLADAEGYELFDMHTFTKENVNIKDFEDKLHPNDKGYAVMAKKVAELVHQYEG